MHVCSVLAQREAHITSLQCEVAGLQAELSAERSACSALRDHQSGLEERWSAAQARLQTDVTAQMAALQKVCVHLMSMLGTKTLTASVLFGM